MEQFSISLHLENLDDDIARIAFCFPGHNDEPRIRLQWQYSVSKTLPNHYFIRKSVEALITNEDYWLRASNTELKLSTNILHCINYRMHTQTFLSSHY